MTKFLLFERTVIRTMISKCLKLGVKLTHEHFHLHVGVLTVGQGWNKLWGRGGKCPPDFDARGQDYIFVLPLFDSFTTYDQLKYIVNQRITRIKLSALMSTTSVRHVLCTRIGRNDKGPNIDLPFPLSSRPPFPSPTLPFLTSRPLKSSKRAWGAL